MNNSGLQIDIETEIVLSLQAYFAAGDIPEFESLAKRLVTHYNGVSKEFGLPKMHRDYGDIYDGPGTIIELLVTDDQSISPNSCGGRECKLCLQFFYFRVPSNPEFHLSAISVAVATPPKLEILAAWPVARCGASS